MTEEDRIEITNDPETEGYCATRWVSGMPEQTSFGATPFEALEGLDE